ncbi:MAG: glycosyltransferase family 2 protein [Acidobacteriota bacterium]
MLFETNPVPRVTVVMAVYNAAQFLEEAIASILSQSWRDFELIVVDDASTDGSSALLDRFDDPRIRVIHHTSNQGASLSRNDALAAARGEFIAIMDADDVCAPNRLQRQIEYLEAHPAAGLVGCAVYDNIDATGAVLYTSRLPEDNETIQRSIQRRWCFLHSSIVFRRSLGAAAGGYRAAFEPAEDHDFVLRILERTEAHNLSEPLVTYRLNHNGLTVVGHQYVDELRSILIGLAGRRRRGEPENLDAEMPRILALKQKRRAVRGLAGIVQRLRDSLYAAHRYYGFGCRELCAGQMERARRCYIQSLRTNGLFIKSWIGLVLSLLPWVAYRLRFLFRSSMQQHHETVGSRSVADNDSSRLTSVVHGTAAH